MKIKKSVFILALTLALLVGTIAGASSANVQQKITALLRPDLNIEVNGEKKTMIDGSGNVAYPITYNNNTYVPFRAIGDLLGVKVDWDPNTTTAKYITDKDTDKPDPKPDAKGVDLIDTYTWHGDNGLFQPITMVQSGAGKKVKIGDDVVDHWFRGTLVNSGGRCNVWYDLTGEFDTLTLTAYSNYKDVTITVYENKTKDAVLGSFKLPANTAVTQTIQINGAVQILLQATGDAYSKDSDYVYIYNAYLQ